MLESIRMGMWEEEVHGGIFCLILYKMLKGNRIDAGGRGLEGGACGPKETGLLADGAAGVGLGETQ